MTLVPANKTKVYVVSAACLLGLVVILKNILAISPEVISRDVIWFILIYSTFSVVYPESKAGSQPSPLDRPLLWSLLIFLVTVAIIMVYAL